MNTGEPWEHIEGVLNEIVDNQRLKLIALGRRIVPCLTEDDLLQPNDFPELENHPEFRYEEGILEGVQSVRMALLALRQEG